MLECFCFCDHYKQRANNHIQSTYIACMSFTANAPLAPLNAAWYIISKGHAVAESVTQYVTTRSGFNYILHVYIPLVKVSD